MSNPTTKKSIGAGVRRAIDNVHGLEIYPVRYLVTPNDNSPPYEANFLDLQSGGTSNHGKWNGDIAGRPNLLSDLMPLIFERTFNRTQRVTNRLHTVLRALWRYFDTMPPELKVTDLSHLTNLHGGLMLRDFPYFGDVSHLILEARRRLGLPPLSWPPSRIAEPAVADIISENSARSIYKALKHEIRTIKSTWRHTNSLISEQFEDSSCKLGPSDAALVEIFSNPTPLFSGERLALLKTNIRFPQPPLPLLFDVDVNPSNIGLARNVSEAKRVKKLKHSFYRWIVPGKSETNTFLLAFLLQTGWNLESALRLNLKDWIIPQPLHDRLVVLHSIKHKNNSIVTAISLAKPEFQPFRLIQALAEANKPLRDKAADLARRLGMADSGEQNTLLLRKKRELEFMANSPWTYAAPDVEDGLHCLFPWGAHNSPGRTLRALIEKHQISLLNPQGMKLNPEKLKTGDFRDLWVGFAYARSGHHWLAGMIAAGHKTSDAIKSYLRAHRWRQYGEGQIGAFLKAFWSEIRGRRIVDGTILRALVERGELTETQRELLVSGRSRTRVGMGCTDPRQPPKHIAPDHPAGEVCAVQRCVLCWRALLFRESLDGLCRRRAELEAIQTSRPWTTTLQSSDSEELEVLEANLAANFESTEVEQVTELWRQRIARGEHRPIHEVGMAAVEK